MRVKGEEEGRYVIQAECRRQGKRPIHTPTDRGVRA